MNVSENNLRPDPNHIPMPCLWKTQKDLQDRLGGTYVRYAGRIVYCDFGFVEDKKGKEHPGIILWDALAPHAGKPIAAILDEDIPDDEDLDVSSFELGYMNFSSHPKNVDTSVVYLTRAPSKQWKQGLVFNRLRVSDIGGTKIQMSMHIKYIYDSLLGKYPTVSEFLRDPTPRSVALTRQVAIKKELSGVILVYINCKNVGAILDGRLSLKDDDLKWVYARILSPVFGEHYEIHV